jgi:hypothetical protein
MAAVTKAFPGDRAARSLALAGVVAALAVASLAGCTPGIGGQATGTQAIGAQVTGASQSTGCRAIVAALAASQRTSLIAVIPRTSAQAAVWGLRELAQLLPSLARPGFELHVLYTQDSDDLSDSGGDGEPPQVMLTQSPAFSSYAVGGVPQSPPNPTPLSSHLYCDRLAAWNAHAARAVQAEAGRRKAAVTAWANAAAASLRTRAGRPVPDTTGTESGVEIDASGSIFAAAQVAQAAPQPSILFLGGLTTLRPPSREFRFPARLVALVRSSDPGQVLSAEAAWSAWAHRAGGSFRAVSSNDTSAAVAAMLVG